MTHQNRLPVRGARTTAALVGAVATGLVSPAQANIIINYQSGNQFTYKVNQMPDFDQRRKVQSGILGLPNDGNMYCAPTAASNALAYVQAHGYPALMPLLDNSYFFWANDEPGAYALETLGLGLMGNAMQCDPIDGTGGSGFEDGILQYFHSDWFQVSFVWANGSYAPSAKMMAQAALAGSDGSVVAFCVGWYQPVGGGNYVRNGGHCITLQKAVVNGSAVTLSIRDPWTTDSLIEQSSFSSQSYPTQQKTVTVSGKTRSMSELVGYGGLLDGYAVITPLYGITWQAGQITMISPQVLEWATGSPSKTIHAPDGLPILDVVPSADAATIYFFTKPAGAAGRLWKLAPGASEATQVELAIANPIHACVGPDGKLYVMDGNRIVRCIDLSGPTPTAMQYVAPFDLADITFDDTTGKVVGLSTATKALHLMTFGTTGASGVTANLPSLPSLDQGKASIAFDPTTGAYFLGSENVDALYKALLPAASGPVVEPIVVPGLVKPTNISVDSLGRAMVASNGVMRAYVKNRGSWIEDPTSPFSGKPAANGFLVPRNRSNYSPTENDGPGWHNVPPSNQGPSLIECGADITGDDQVDAQDLAVLLGQWGTDGLADVNDDDVIDQIDLAELLGRWGPCE
ncbi:MAG: hypothetical protein JNL80_10080 [Phycisphaerae bacterium]|nr:hypothetical protein [Phycisphaerae bacterium]